MKNKIQNLKRKMLDRKDKNNPMQKLINDKEFMRKLLEFSHNDVDYMCHFLGDIMVYYSLSNDKKINYPIEELVERKEVVDFYDIKDVMEKGFFTHSCNGNMAEKIKINGLGNPLNNINEELYKAVSHLEQILNLTGTYTNQQSGRKDEVYFSSPGATSFGYAVNFAPERLFLGILNQDRDNSLPIEVGENKKDYYRKVIYKKFKEKITNEVMKDVETVIDGFFSSANSIVCFGVNEIISSDNIYIETIREYSKINLEKHIQDNFFGGNFFTSRTGSNTNTNNMDNLVMINTIISPERLRFLEVPDRYDLIQLIALNKGLKKGEKIDFYTCNIVDAIENKENDYVGINNLVRFEQRDAKVTENELDKLTFGKKIEIFLSYVNKLIRLKKIKLPVTKKSKALPYLTNESTSYNEEKLREELLCNVNKNPIAEDKTNEKIEYTKDEIKKLRYIK